MFIVLLYYQRGKKHLVWLDNVQPSSSAGVECLWAVYEGHLMHKWMLTEVDRIAYLSLKGKKASGWPSRDLHSITSLSVLKISQNLSTPKLCISFIKEKQNDPK